MKCQHFIKLTLDFNARCGRKPKWKCTMYFFMYTYNFSEQVYFHIKLAERYINAEVYFNTFYMKLLVIRYSYEYQTTGRKESIDRKRFSFRFEPSTKVSCFDFSQITKTPFGLYTFVSIYFAHRNRNV